MADIPIEQNEVPQSEEKQTKKAPEVSAVARLREILTANRTAAMNLRERMFALDTEHQDVDLTDEQQEIDALFGDLFGDEENEIIDEVQEDIPGILLQSIQEHFPDGEDQEQVTHAAGEFIQKLTTAIESRKDFEIDDGPLDKIENFAEEFPSHMIETLGDKADAHTVIRILSLGSQIVDLSLHKKRYTYSDSRSVLHAVNEVVPSVIVQSDESADDVLDIIESKIDTNTPRELIGFIRYNQENQELSPAARERIGRLKERLDRIEAEVAVVQNAFTQADREPWKNKLVMDKVDRPAKWSDLTTMLFASEKDNREYGLTVSQPLFEEGTTQLQFVRGDKAEVRNADCPPDTENVFFHSHPNIVEERVGGALVSSGDIMATSQSDRGGAYLNIVCESGISLHIGGQKEPDYVIGEKYVIESGEKKGRILAKRAGGKFLEEMKDTHEPWVYSLTTFGKRSYFVHIPWEHVNTSVDMQNVCFGDGLQQLVAGIEDVPDIPVPRNLREAIKQTKRNE